MSTDMIPEPQNTLDNPARRVMLKGGAGAVAALGLMQMSPSALATSQVKVPEFAEWKRIEDLIIHSANTMETVRGAIRSGVITPAPTLFVRNNLPAPSSSITANADDWEVSFAGVKNPRTLKVSDLKKMGATTVASVLQCSGNGRAFFPHGAAGTQWSVGAAGCVMWTGVPLKDVIASMGGSVSGMRYITGTGGEEIPAGIDPKTVMVERSVPMAALENAMLAWQMNDEPLDLAHGGPLRLVFPGYYGVNNVKYVKNVAMTENQTDAKIQASGYRIRDIGKKGSTEQPSMYEMNVKSWITGPLETANAGENLIYGVAFGGIKAVQKIEVSLDNGRNWQAAQFVGPDLGPFAWRPFVFKTNLKAGEYRVVSRATDVDGTSQPRERFENERGYLHNGWEDHGVTIKV